MKFLKIILITLVGLNFCLVSEARMTKEEAAILFQQANQLYKESRYEAAIDKYQKIIEQGLSSSSIHYNLANSYMKVGELGKAVLSYERAQELNPRDGDVLSNLKYAESQIRLTSKKSSPNMLTKYFRDFIQYYSINDFFLVLAGLFGILILFHLVKLFLNILRLTLTVLMVTLVILISVFTVGAVIKYNQVSNEAVITDATKARFEPLVDSTVHYEVPEGAKVKWIRKEGSWVKIERADGLLGWIPSSFVEKVEIDS